MDYVAAPAEGRDLIRQRAGNRSDEIRIFKRPSQAREVSWWEHVAIEIVSSNADGRADAFQAPGPRSQESRRRKIMPPHRIVGLETAQPIDQVHGVGHGRVPLAETSYTLYTGVAVFVRHHARLQPSGHGGSR